jgi:hypothetical protein
VYGTLGAAAPEVVRIYRTADISLMRGPLSLICFSIAFVLLGGIFADAWEDDRAIKCLYLGATFPIWISAWAHSLAPAAAK